MEQSAVEAAALAGSVSAYDFSVWSLFLRADLIVKVVIVLLVLASIWCWAIIIEKTLWLRRLNAWAADFETTFWSGGSLEVLYDRIGPHPKDPMTAVFVAAMQEWRRSAAKGIRPVDRLAGGLHERIERVMQITVTREMDRVERYMTFLASTGATAPFVGLFGTVWGIMNSFQSIAMSKSTSLVVVAPGIAEALFATALGLLAAIPAVVAYNKLSKELDRYAGRLDTFAGEFSAILSRQSEEHA
ncbi:MAG: protein TolQ [Rhodospirillales bacterium]|jgi:biopolymer transport protein TolQ|nr:protein TolQ [Rhodospirillales bacterium]